MNAVESYKTHFRYKQKYYDAIIKLTTFPNNYQIAKVIIDHQQFWVLNDLVLWKLMTDHQSSIKFEKLILKHLNNMKSTTVPFKIK